MPMRKYTCRCGVRVAKRRWNAGYQYCPACFVAPTRTVACAYNKGAPQLITNTDDLKTVHKK